MQVTGGLGVLSPFVGGDYYGAIIAGISQAAHADDRRVIAIQTLDPGSHSADISGVPDFRHPIAWQHLDGLIILPGAVPPGYAQRAQAEGKVVVLVSHELDDVKAPAVFADNRSGVREAVDHLVEHGHRRIAFAGNLAVSDVHERYEGYREALVAHDVDVLPELLFVAVDNHESGGSEVADALVQAGMPATAIVMGTDRNAIGLIERLHALGRRLPAELAVVGFDNIADTRYVAPSLSSVHQPLDQLGSLSYEILARLLAGEDIPDEPHTVPTAFVHRDSCGCPSSGLQLSEQQARSQFRDNSYLQMTLNIQYELAIELLRTNDEHPQRLSWLSKTPARGGVFAMWPDAAKTEPGAVPAADDPRIQVVGTFRADGPDPAELGGWSAVSQFPPDWLFDLASGSASDLVFMVPVRTQSHDWGVLAAVGRIQDSTPPGREMMNHSGALLGVALDQDVMLNAMREQEQQLRRAALYDQLTGLPNRSLLFDRLNQAGHRAARHKDHHFALLFLDLDGFKAVNDSLGHAAGDELLVQVAHRLRLVVRQSDTAARLGGDEFVILLDGIDLPDGPKIVMDRIEQAFDEPIMLDGKPASVGASVGMALSTEGFTTAEELLRQADAAMYDAKMARKARRAAGQSSSH